MKKQEDGVSSKAQGATDGKKVLDLPQVQSLLKRDLHACLLMLQAIHDDQDALDGLALILHGKYLNSLHKAELDKQLEIQP